MVHPSKESCGDAPKTVVKEECARANDHNTGLVYELHRDRPSGPRCICQRDVRPGQAASSLRDDPPDLGSY